MKFVTLTLLAGLSAGLAPAAHAAQEFEAPIGVAPAAEAQPVFGGALLGLPTETELTREIPLRPFMTRHRVVSVDGAVVESLRRQEYADGARFDLELFPGRTITLRPKTFRETRSNSFVTSGEIAGDRLGWFTLASERGVLAAHIRTGDGKLFSLRYLGPGQHWIAEIDESAIPDCGVGQPGVVPMPEPGPPQPPAPPGPGKEGQDADNPNGDPDVAFSGSGEDFDVLVVYTPAARNRAGGALAMNAAIEVAVQEGDDALGLSAVSASLCLVGIMEIDYSESGATFGTHLNRLTNGLDGSMDQIGQWRGACGADLVSLIVDDSDGGTLCGLAWLKPGALPFAPVVTGPFNVNDIDCLPGLTLIHELGHNYGCEHDWGGHSGLSFNDAKGHNFTGSSGSQWRTIMARNSNPGTRILRYSNPGVNFDSTPTGILDGLFVTNPANNASAINFNSGATEGLNGSVAKSSAVFVDFNTFNPIQTGSSTFPYNLLEEGLLRASNNALVTLRGNGPVQVPTLAQDVRLTVDSGDVALGN